VSKANHKTNSESNEFLTRTQTFLSGATMVWCSCGEAKCFPNPTKTGKCPQGFPWECLSLRALPLELEAQKEETPTQ